MSLLLAEAEKALTACKDRIAELEAARLTLDEVIAAIFAVDDYKTKARRDGDLLQPEHKAAVDRVLRKLRDEYDRQK